MLQGLIYTLGSVLIVSLISLIGVLSIIIKEKWLDKILLYFVSFAAGSFFGDVFIHLLPNAVSNTFGINISLYVLSGIIMSFFLEKIILWRHCHIPACEGHKSKLSYMVLIGDTVHNFIDGLIIGASYLVDIKVGIATTLAVIFHEIPQEIGDFSILLYSGFTKVKALLFNFLSALSAFIGAILVFFVSNSISINPFLIPFAAGNFLYIAGSDLIPEMHKEMEIKRSLMQLACFILGILVMLLLTFIEVPS